MESHAARIYARLFVAGTVGLATLIGHASVAGAQTTPAPAVIVTFEVTATGQTPVAVEASTVPTDDDMNAAVYNRMLDLADAAKAGCGTYQVDLAEASGPWAAPIIGVPFPENTPGVLSAITGIVGTGTCVAPPTPVPPVTDAPPATTAPPVVDTPPAETVTEVTDAPPVATPVPDDSLRRTFVVTEMPNTGGAHIPEVVGVGVFLLIAGLLVSGLSRLTQKQIGS